MNNQYQIVSDDQLAELQELTDPKWVDELVNQLSKDFGKLSPERLHDIVWGINFGMHSIVLNIEDLHSKGVEQTPTQIISSIAELAIHMSMAVYRIQKQEQSNGN